MTLNINKFVLKLALNKNVKKRRGWGCVVFVVLTCRLYFKLILSDLILINNGQSRDTGNIKHHTRHMTNKICIKDKRAIAIWK
jgi:hypothetical protein